MIESELWKDDEFQMRMTAVKQQLSLLEKNCLTSNCAGYTTQRFLSLLKQNMEGLNESVRLLEHYWSGYVEAQP